MIQVNDTCSDLFNKSKISPKLLFRITQADTTKKYSVFVNTTEKLVEFPDIGTAWHIIGDHTVYTVVVTVEDIYKLAKLPIIGEISL